MTPKQVTAPDPNHRIISKSEAAKIRGVSPDTLKRNSDRGGNPRRVRISARRIGYWYDEVVASPAWIRSFLKMKNPPGEPGGLCA